MQAILTVLLIIVMLAVLLLMIVVASIVMVEIGQYLIVFEPLTFVLD